MNLRNPVLTLVAITGGLLAAALAPIGIAAADDWTITPDDSTFVPVAGEGPVLVFIPGAGLPPLFEYEMGTESLAVKDATVGITFPDVVTGSDTHFVFGSFTNDDFVDTLSFPEQFTVTDQGGDISNFTVLPGTEVDLANFGGGFENEWINIPGTGVTDMLITPFGDFNLL